MTPILCVYFDGDQAVSQFVLGEVWQQYHISIDVSVQVSWNFTKWLLDQGPSPAQPGPWARAENLNSAPTTRC